MVPEKCFLCTQTCTKSTSSQGLWPIDSEIGLGRLLFLGRLLTGDKMAPVVRNRFEKLF